MKKILSGLIFIIIIGLVIGLYYFFNNLDYLIKTAIEKYGSQAAQTTVRVQKVKTSLPNAAIAINGLTVANPDTFDFANVFSMNEISTKININSLKEEPYIVEEIVIRAPEVFFEVNNDKKINLDRLKKNITSSRSKTTQTKTEAKKDIDTKSKSAPRIIIRRVLFTGGKILAKITPLKDKEYTLKLPTLDMKNLGGKNGATPDKIAREILDRLTDQAKRAIKEKGIDRELDKLKGKLKAKIDAEKAKLKAKAEAEKAKAKEKVETEKVKAKAKIEAKKQEERDKIEAEKAKAKAKLEAEKEKAKEKLKSLFN